ncbi:MAG: bifunctional (p)ppGpp synthetase/guanosine-3',5'-bis(diphosphate) 3'-pyrophosphohydrolase [Clostridia bacterium]|nr:bifunctional (p)ppGpp synthetase/guanosine-3',5'-bis(diphosphate) 3'-pyrophosphohydrolase [Clostridia bacterium]
MIRSERYEAALRYATAMHEGQTRRGGEPYITHPMAVAAIVASQGYDEDTQITALFHDLLEDTAATDSEILALSNEAVLRAVKCLTKTEGYRMEAYIAAIRENEMARVVKAADRLHNLRCAVVCEEAFKRRYIRESREWYLDFSPEIIEAVEALEQTLLPRTGEA